MPRYNAFSCYNIKTMINGNFSYSMNFQFFLIFLYFYFFVQIRSEPPNEFVNVLEPIEVTLKPKENLEKFEMPTTEFVVNAEELKSLKGKNEKKLKQMTKTKTTKLSQSNGLLRKLGALAVLSMTTTAGAVNLGGVNYPEIPEFRSNLIKICDNDTSNCSALYSPINNNIIIPVDKNEIKNAHKFDDYINDLKQAKIDGKGPTDFEELFKMSRAKTTNHKLFLVKQLWEQKLGKIANSHVFEEMYNATTNAEKLSLLQELYQRTMGGKCRCDDKIDLADWENMEKIGTTYFSSHKAFTLVRGPQRALIYPASSESLGKCVSVKEVPLGIRKPEVEDRFKNEIQILKVLEREGAKHDVKLYESEIRTDKIMMAKEADWLNVQEFWQRNKHNKMGLATKLFYDMLQVVDELHKFGAHLNLKMADFVLAKDEHGTYTIIDGDQTFNVSMKLRDLATALLIDPDKYDEKVPKEHRDKIKIDKNAPIKMCCTHGSLSSLSPEQLIAVEEPGGESHVEASTKSDIWSMGAILYEMMSPKGKGPVDTICDPMVIGQGRVTQCMDELYANPETIAGQIPYPSEKEMAEQKNKFLWHIIKVSLQHNPAHRPSAKAIGAYLRDECWLVSYATKELLGKNMNVPLIECEN